jgi:hypothetical protein
VVHNQHIVGIVLDEPRDSLAVLRPEHERFENQQVERPLQMRGVGTVGALSDRHST